MSKGTQHRALQYKICMSKLATDFVVQPTDLLKNANILKAVGIKLANEKLIGGMGDNKPDSAFVKKELLKGIGHEGEHTRNKRIAKEIAKDHLSERADYYTALAKAKLGTLKY